MNILINNAGTQNEDDIDVNLKALIHITEKYGVQKDIKSILNVGSASAHTGAEFPECDTVFITHGHTFNEGALPMLNPGDVLLHGHTHVPKCVEHEDYIYMNPGSTSIPKEESWHGYMTLEAGEFLWKDFDGEIKMQFHF